MEIISIYQAGYSQINREIEKNVIFVGIGANYLGQDHMTSQKLFYAQSN